MNNRAVYTLVLSDIAVETHELKIVDTKQLIFGKRGIHKRTKHVEKCAHP